MVYINKKIANELKILNNRRLRIENGLCKEPVSDEAFERLINRIKEIEPLLHINKQEELARWRADLQRKTIPAKRHGISFTLKEYLDQVTCEYYPDEMVDMALKWERSFYSIDHVVRQTQFYLKNGRFSKQIEGTSVGGTYIEPVTDLLEKAIKIVYNI